MVFIAIIYVACVKKGNGPENSFASNMEIPLTPPVAKPLVDLKKYIPVDIIRMPRLRNRKYLTNLKNDFLVG